MLKTIDSRVNNNPDVFLWIGYNGVDYTTAEEELQVSNYTEVSDFEQRSASLEEGYEIVSAFPVQKAMGATLRYTREVSKGIIDADLGSGF